MTSPKKYHIKNNTTVLAPIHHLSYPMPSRYLAERLCSILNEYEKQKQFDIEEIYHQLQQTLMALEILKEDTVKLKELINEARN